MYKNKKIDLHLKQISEQKLLILLLIRSLYNVISVV